MSALLWIGGYVVGIGAVAALGEILFPDADEDKRAAAAIGWPLLPAVGVVSALFLVGLAFVGGVVAGGMYLGHLVTGRKP